MLFKNKQLQKELEKNGYVVVSFLSLAEVELLNTFYNEIHSGGDIPNIIDGIHMTTWCTDHNYKNKISAKLNNIFREPSERFFSDFRRLNNVFIVKKTGRDTTFKVHQDWNVIDETEYQSVNVWIPLHDVDENSGALWVLKGSHKINRKIRGAGYLFPDYSPYFSELEKKSTSVKLKAGEAIIFYHSIIHGSPPNLASTDRKAACFTVVPKSAPLCIYFQPNENAPLEQHEPEDDFMFNYNYLRTESTHNPPSKKPKKLLPSYKNKKVDDMEIKKIVNNRGWLSKILG